MKRSEAIKQTADHITNNKFLFEKNSIFDEVVRQIPDNYWAKYDLSAMRAGWEAHVILCQKLISNNVRGTP
jgi:hypothetical protein